MKVGIIFGGASKEHNVSLVSAKCLSSALNRSKWTPVLLGISTDGHWYRLKEADLARTTFDQPVNIDQVGELIFRKHPQGELGAWLQSLSLDVAFPIVHGTTGEDGTLQGFLQTLGVPYVGCGVAASALAMDKEYTKVVLAHEGLPVVPFLVVRDLPSAPSYEHAAQKLGSTLFVKPCNLGSSVGVTKVTNKDQWLPALKEAFRHDQKVLVERAVSGDEVEVAIKGSSAKAEASLPGTFKMSSDFYSYDAKYLSKEETTYRIPAFEDAELLAKIKDYAIRAFKAIGGEGMARVDFFHERGALFLNEINTLPGFTPISMYPMLWEKSGVKYSDLVDELLELALKSQPTSN